MRVTNLDNRQQQLDRKNGQRPLIHFNGQRSLSNTQQHSSVFSITFNHTRTHNITKCNIYTTCVDKVHHLKHRGTNLAMSAGVPKLLNNKEITAGRKKCLPSRKTFAVRFGDLSHPQPHVTGGFRMWKAANRAFLLKGWEEHINTRTKNEANFTGSAYNGSVRINVSLGANQRMLLSIKCFICSYWVFFLLLAVC